MEQLNQGFAIDKRWADEARSLATYHPLMTPGFNLAKAMLPPDEVELLRTDLLDRYMARYRELVDWKEMLLVRSLFHEATGVLPTDEAMTSRITVLHYRGAVEYYLDRSNGGVLDPGTMLLRRDAGSYEPIPLTNSIRTTYHSPLFV